MKEKETTKKKATTKEQPKAETKKLYRSRRDVLIAGVASGIAEYLGIDASIIRLLFILGIVFSGFAIPLYIVLWIILPVEKKDEVATAPTVRHNIAEMKTKVNGFAKEITTSGDGRGRKIIALILIGIGCIFLLESLDFFNEEFIWPLVLIIIGLLILFNRK